MKVICLTAWKFSGKDMLADYLVNKYGGIRVAFADPLKDSVAEEYGISRELLDDPKQKEQPILTMPVTPKDAFSRHLVSFMQGEFRSGSGKKILGSKFNEKENEFKWFCEGDKGELIQTQAFFTPRSLAILKGSVNRTVNPNYWVNLAFNDIRHIENSKPGSIFVISDLRYRSEIAQVEKEFGQDAIVIRIERFDTSPSTDPSERDLDEWDFKYRINNRGTKEEAFEQLDRLIKSIF